MTERRAPHIHLLGWACLALGVSAIAYDELLLLGASRWLVYPGWLAALYGLFWLAWRAHRA